MYHQVPAALITWSICINDDFPRGLRYSDASFYIDYASITTVVRLFFFLATSSLSQQQKGLRSPLSGVTVETAAVTLFFRRNIRGQYRCVHYRTASAISTHSNDAKQQGSMKEVTLSGRL